MLSKEINDALNKQINAEMWSAYLYLSMSANCAELGLPGFANWFKVQFKEEQDHAFKIMNYIVAKDGTVELFPIQEVKTSWESIMTIFDETLAHEKVVSGCIHNLVELARKEQDYSTEAMLRWFVDEQVEEEDTVKGHIDSLKMIGSNGFGIYMMDKELASRQYAPIV